MKLSTRMRITGRSALFRSVYRPALALAALCIGVGCGLGLGVDTGYAVGPGLDVDGVARSLQATPTPEMPPTEEPNIGNPGRRVAPVVYLPALNFVGKDAICETWLRLQNLGCDGLKAVLMTYGEPGFCPPQAAGPLKASCTGLIAPGRSWAMLGAQIPTGSKSGILYQFTDRALSDFGLSDPHGIHGTVADLMCETLWFDVLSASSRFHQAYVEGSSIWGIPQDIAAGHGRLAVKVERRCPTETLDGPWIHSSYRGMIVEELGSYDPLADGHVYHAALARVDEGMDTLVNVQNVGYACANIEFWLQSSEDCADLRLCDLQALAMGEAAHFSAKACVEDGFRGSVRVISNQPLAGVVDYLGRKSFASLTLAAKPRSDDPVAGPGAMKAQARYRQVLRAPLAYKRLQGASSTLHLVNQNSNAHADLSIQFVGASGSTVLALRDWLCPGGSRDYALDGLADLPAGWSGSIRVTARVAADPLDASDSPGGSQGGARHALPEVAGAVSQSPADAPATIVSAYPMIHEQTSMMQPDADGPEAVGLANGFGVVALPGLGGIARPQSGGRSEVAVLLAGNGVTQVEVGAYFFDANARVDHLCRRLYPDQVWRLDARSLSFLGSEFRGDAIISASRWWVEEGASRSSLSRVGLMAVDLSRADQTDASWAAATGGEVLDAAGASTGQWLMDPSAFEKGRHCSGNRPPGPPCP